MHNPKFHTLLQRMAEMHNKKNADYANEDPYSNFKEAAATSGCTVDQVFAVLLGVKLARLKELLGKGKTPNNESIDDSRLDLAVYSALWASYHLPSQSSSQQQQQQITSPSSSEEVTTCGSRPQSQLKQPSFPNL